MPHICALCAHASILRMASSYKLFVFKPKSEDIIYIREIFPDTTPMALGGGLPWAGEPSESAAPVMPSVVTAARAAGDQRQLLLPVDADYSCRSWGETVWYRWYRIGHRSAGSATEEEANGRQESTRGGSSIGMSVRTARTWQTGRLPSEKKGKRWWRTRPDPFAGVWATRT